MNTVRVIVCAVALMSSVLASASDRLPWTFGMTHAEVKAVAAYAPYGTFRNGDLETYKGVFDGRERNFQFFFTDDKLRRIGVYTYEGRDFAAAAQAWLALYRSMAKEFGPIDTLDNRPPSLDGADTQNAFVSRAMEMVQRNGKTQMAPLKQPLDRSVFSSLMRSELNGQSYYYVILYFDRRS